MPMTLDLPPIDTAELDRAEKQALAEKPVSQQLAPIAPTTPDLTKIDLTDVALAMYGPWRKTLAETKDKLSTLVLDLSTPTKIKEARTLRTRLILEPLAAGRKVNQGIKSALAKTSKAVGLELTTLEAGYEEADGLILPQIETAEQKQREEAEAKAKVERERVEKHQGNIARIRAYAEKAEQPDMTAERIAAGMAQLEAIPEPTKEAWEEFAVPAADAICWTLERMRITHARVLRAEQAEAEAAELRAKLAAQASAAVIGVDPASPTGDMGVRVEGVRNEDGTTTITKIEYTEGQAPAQVLKAEAATPDATAADVPADASPSVGSMGAGQAADAAPAGGGEEVVSMPALAVGTVIRAAGGPFTFIEPAAPANEVPTLTLGAICERLGFVLTTEFVQTLGFERIAVGPKSKLYTESQYRGIKAALIAHIEGLQ